MATMVQDPVLPRGSIVRFRNARHAMYQVVYDFGDLSGGGMRFSEIEPFPNLFDDEPRMVLSRSLVLVDDELEGPNGV